MKWSFVLKLRKNSVLLLDTFRLFLQNKQNTCLPRNAGRLEVTGINHFVSSSDFMGFERNPMKLYRELD